LYTDGITEAKNFKGEEYGYDRLADIINNNADREAEEIQELLISDLYDFCGNSEIDDDYTAVIVKFK
jgi:serine phosphatase RsbU (regulator of sigma subunit)